MRSRFEEAKRRVEQTRENDRLDALERAAAERDGGVRVLDLMGADDVEPGLESGDGFFISHNVLATEPWHVSRVDLGERPRVAPATRNRQCEQCGFWFQGTTQSRYCNGPACNRARTAARVARHRAAQR